MQFESFAHVPLTDEVLAHIWEGEPGDLNQGGHRFGLGREGKTEFPESWALEMVERAVRLTLDQPQSIHFSGQFIFLRRLVNLVIIEVRVIHRGSSYSVISAYPISGEGIARNVRGLRVVLPIDFRQLVG